jgi:hypothetical protein
VRRFSRIRWNGHFFPGSLIPIQLSAYELELIWNPLIYELGYNFNERSMDVRVYKGQLVIHGSEIFAVELTAKNPAS